MAVTHQKEKFVAHVVCYYDDLHAYETEFALGDPDDGEVPFESYVDAKLAGNAHVTRFNASKNANQFFFTEVYILRNEFWDLYEPSEQEALQLQFQRVSINT